MWLIFRGNFFNTEMPLHPANNSDTKYAPRSDSGCYAELPGTHEDIYIWGNRRVESSRANVSRSKTTAEVLCAKGLEVQSGK